MTADGARTGRRGAGDRVALWDLAGQALGMPVHQLPGGKLRDRVRIYADCHSGVDWTRDEFAERVRSVRAGGPTPAPYRPEAFGQRAKQVKEELGFTALKFDLDVPVDGLRLDWEDRSLTKQEIEYMAQICAAIRENIGDTDFAVNCHARWNTSDAIRLAHALEPYDLLWFEDPVPPQNVDAMAKVTRAVKQPVCTSEALVGRHGFRELPVTQASDIVQPDIPRAGVLAECRASLYAICDPEEVNRRARAHQQRIDEAGGVASIVARSKGGGFSRAPVSGVAVQHLHHSCRGREGYRMNVSRRSVTRRTAALTIAGVPALVACAGPGDVGSAGSAAAPAAKRRTGLRLTTSACGQLQADLPRIDAVWAQFAAVSGNTAVHEEHGSNCNTYWEKTQTTLAAGTPNDIISATPPQQALLAELGHVVNLAPLMKRDRYDLADYFESAVSQYLYKDKRIGMPRGYASQIPYMNRSMFEQGGGAVPSGSFEDRAWTWQAFLEACQRVTGERAGVQQWGYALGRGFREWGAWVASNGGQVLDKDLKRCLLDQPPALEAIQFLADLRLRHQVTPPPDVLAKQNAQALFLSGRLGMWPNTMAKVVGTGEQVQGFTFDVAAVPRGRAAALPGGGGTGWAIPRASPHAEEAWQLLRFLLRTDNMTTLGDVWFPPRKSAAQSHAQQNAAKLPRNRAVPYEAALRTVAPPTHPRWNEVEQLLNEEISAVVNGERATREAMHRAVPRVNALLDGAR